MIGTIFGALWRYTQLKRLSDYVKSTPYYIMARAWYDSLDTTKQMYVKVGLVALLVLGLFA